MLISVDLPAPFSPMMPVIAPFSIDSDTPRTACTLPNDLSIFSSSIAPVTCKRSLAAVVGHVVDDVDLAGDDVGLGRFDLGLHLGRDQLLVVLVERPVDAAFLEAKHLHVAFPLAVLHRLETVV